MLNIPWPLGGERENVRRLSAKSRAHGTRLSSEERARYTTGEPYDRETFVSDIGALLERGVAWRSADQQSAHYWHRRYHAGGARRGAHAQSRRPQIQRMLLGASRVA